MPAPTLVATASTAYSGTTSPKTSSSLSVQAGDLLVVTAGGSDGTTLNTPTNSGAALTWTLQASVALGTSWGTAYVWTATVDTNRSLTVSVSRNTGGGTTNFGFTAYAYRNHAGVGNVAFGNVSSTAAALSLTTSANSAVALAATDFNPATGTATWRSVNGAPTVDVDTTANNRFYAANYPGTGTAGTNTYGLSAPTGMKWSAVAVEIKSIITVTQTASATWTIQGQVTKTASATWGVDMLSVTKTASATWNVLKVVTQTAQASWTSEWLGSWAELIHTDAWTEMVTAEERTISARAELVDLNGVHMRDLVFDAASIDFRGEDSEQWAGRVTFSDPAMAPLRPTDPLDPRSLLRARFWWRIEWEGAWFEVPVGTFILGDPDISDSASGSYGITVTMRDVLEEVRRNEYGEKLVTVSGMTVDAALKRLFGALAPWARVAAPASTVTLPSTYQLGVDKADPADDWAAIADLAGWVVRTDRMGTIVCGPPADRAGIVADWQEGPDCPVTDMGRKISNTGIYNQVLVRSTSHDAVGVYAIVEDSDPASPTWVGRYGPFMKVIETDTVTDEAGCRTVAQMHLGRLLRPTETVTVSVPARPDLNYRDQVALAREKSAVGGTYRVSGWKLELGPANAAPKTMDVTLMTRSLE